MNPNPEKPRERFALKWVLKALMVVLPVSLLIGFWVQREKAEQEEEIRVKLDGLRAKGFPVTEAELRAFFPNPPLERNITNLLSRSLSSLPRKLPFDDPTKFPRGTNRFSQNDSEKIIQFLEEMKPALEEIPRPWPPNVTVTLRTNQLFERPDDFPLVPLRYLTLTLMLKIFSHAEGGEAEQAIEWLAVGINLNRGFFQTLPYMIGRGNEGYIALGLEPILNHTRLTEERLRKLKVLLEEEGADALHSALIFEQCEGIFIFEFYKKGGEDLLMHPNFENLRFASSRLVGITPPLFSYPEYVEFLIITEDWLKAAHAKNEDRWKTMVTLENQLRKKDQSIAAWAAQAGLVGKTKREMETVSRLRVGQTAVGIERYRLMHGKLPDTLEDLVPEFLSRVPNDPFKNEPLKLKLNPPGYTVYGVGPDGKDDGGANLNYKDPRAPKGDITIQVGR